MNISSKFYSYFSWGCLREGGVHSYNDVINRIRSGHIGSSIDVLVTICGASETEPQKQ